MLCFYVLPGDPTHCGLFLIQVQCSLWPLFYIHLLYALLLFYVLQEKRPNVSDTGETEKKGLRSVGSLFTKQTPSAAVQVEAVIDAELNSYLMVPVITGESDPLAWWKIHTVNFPILSRLARKYLCVPATSSPSERLFSASGNIVTCERACLKPEMVDMLVFLAKNL